MSWGTEFKTDIYLSRQSYSSKYEVEEEMEKIENSIKDVENRIKMYVSSNPKDIIPDDWNEEPISWLNNNITEEFELYSECLIDRYKLNLYLKYLNENETKVDDKIDTKN